MRLSKTLLISGVIGFVLGLFFFSLAALWTWSEILSSIFMFLGRTIMWPITALYPFVLFNVSIPFPNFIMILLNIVYFCFIGLIIWSIVWIIRKVV